MTGPGHNDPHLSAAASGRDFSVPVSNYLLRRDIYDEKYSIIGDLAKSWETSQDGLTYTFKLNKGAKYHNVPPVNGRQFTSEDAKYNLLRVIANPSVVNEPDRAKFQRKAEFGSIESIDTPGSNASAPSRVLGAYHTSLAFILFLNEAENRYAIDGQ